MSTHQDGFRLTPEDVPPAMAIFAVLRFVRGMPREEALVAAFREWHLVQDALYSGFTSTSDGVSTQVEWREQGLRGRHFASDADWERLIRRELFQQKADHPAPDEGEE